VSSQLSPSESGRETGGLIPGVSPIPGGWAERPLTVAGREYRLMLPASPDAFLDDPAVQALSRREDYMPYWPFLWPASLPMAELIARHPWPSGGTALEIGCGVGFVGLVALDCGLNVTFSDYQQDAVDVALFNARRNGHSKPVGRLVDWRLPIESKFEVIFGSDVLYEIGNHAPILSLLKCGLYEEGSAWFGDAGRQHAEPFIHNARSAGFVVDIRDEHGGRLVEPQIGRFQLITISR
jgi:predicted nicotinamide N-methyase